MLLPLAGNALGSQLGCGDAGMRVGGAGHIAHHGGQIELQRALVHSVFQGISPQAGLFGIGLDQLHLRRLAAREAQIVNGLLVDGKHGGGCTVFGSHVGDGGTVANGEAARPFAVKLQIAAHHFLLAQELGQGQHDIGGGNALWALAAQLHPNDLGQAHPRCTAQHDVFGFEAAHADSDHAQCIHMGGVAVRADQRIWICFTIDSMDHRAHALQIDLVHDAVARWNHFHILERALAPVDEVKAVLVAAVFNGAVFLEGIGVESAALYCQRVVHNQLHGNDRVDGSGVAALVGNGITQAGQIDQRCLTQDVVADHARREPGKVALALALDDLRQAFGEDGGLATTHQIFCMHAAGVGQGRPCTGADGFDGSLCIEVVQGRAGQGFAVASGVGGAVVWHCLGRFFGVSGAVRKWLLKSCSHRGCEEEYELGVRPRHRQNVQSPVRAEAGPETRATTARPAACRRHATGAAVGGARSARSSAALLR